MRDVGHADVVRRREGEKGMSGRLGRWRSGTEQKTWLDTAGLLARPLVSHVPS
jgi:hypothetical protein